MFSQLRTLFFALLLAGTACGQGVLIVKEHRSDPETAAQPLEYAWLDLYDGVYSLRRPSGEFLSLPGDLVIRELSYARLAAAGSIVTRADAERLENTVRLLSDTLQHWPGSAKYLQKYLDLNQSALSGFNKGYVLVNGDWTLRAAWLEQVERTHRQSEARQAASPEGARARQAQEAAEQLRSSQVLEEHRQRVETLQKKLAEETRHVEEEKKRQQERLAALEESTRRQRMEELAGAVRQSEAAQAKRVERLVILIVCGFIVGGGAVFALRSWQSHHWQTPRWAHAPPPPGPPPEEAAHARVLGLQGKVSLVDIKQHWRERILEYHPDKVAGLGPKLREVAESESRRINAAYEFFCRKYESQQRDLARR